MKAYAYKPPDFPPFPHLNVNGLIGACFSPSFEKLLISSDVKGDQSKLSLNKLDVENFLLPLLNKNEVVDNGIHVTVCDIKGKEYPMAFRVWGSRV